MAQYKYQLEERDLPRQWYNIQADLPTPLPPPIHPATHEPIGPEALAPLFPMALIEQEGSTERFTDIPKASPPPAPTSPTPQSPRPTTTSRRASGG